MTFRAFIFICLSLLTTIVMAKVNNQVEGVRIWASPDNTRVIFELSNAIEHQVFTLENPNRIVVDFSKSRLKSKLGQLNLDESCIANVRYAHSSEGRLRVVFDMKEPVKPHSFLLQPQAKDGHRLIIDLKHSTKHVIKSAAATTTQPSKTIEAILPSREFVVAIDPGHGGEDTGAIGKHNQLREKDVVFAVSKKLVAMINAQPGMRAFLVREGDYYVDLRKRMNIARKKEADLFISVHADSFEDSKASGASVYVLSEKGASNEASRWLAERENRSDLIGGVSLEDKGNVLAHVLLDLSQTASQHASHDLAGHLITNLSNVTDMHSKTVQRAGFKVLKSPDIPSVLVELGFISNRAGEKKLSSQHHQQVLAQALLAGIKSYKSKRSYGHEHSVGQMAMK